MKNKVLTIILTLMLCVVSQHGFAQKYGHMNSGNLLEMLPEVKSGDAELEKMRISLFDALQVKVKALEEKFARLQKQMSEGGLSPVQQQKAEEELNNERQAIIKEEEAINLQLQQKRVDLLQPIFDKVNKAIEDIGREKGYTMIFDTSKFNALLFVQDTDDVMPLVKAKLGL